jgi:hypothetical protein
MIDRSPGFDWDEALRKGAFGTGPARSADAPPAPDAEPAPPAPVAPSRARMAPIAREMRRAGREPHARVAPPGDGMLVYRDMLRRIQPATDHQVSSAIRVALDLDGRDHVAWCLSSVNGRRNDWLELDPTCIEAVGKLKVPGSRGRTLWRIKAGSIADTYGGER